MGAEQRAQSASRASYTSHTPHPMSEKFGLCDRSSIGIILNIVNLPQKFKAQVNQRL